MQEEWRPIPEDSRYQVSNLGNARGPRGPLKLGHRKGYPCFSIPCKPKKAIMVHKAVCALFNGPPPEGKTWALHTNHVKTDCRAENLHWGDCQDNIAERNQAGRTNRRLTTEQVASIRTKFEAGQSNASIGREFGIVPQYVPKVAKGLTWGGSNATA